MLICIKRNQCRDHRKVSVETYLKGMHHTLSRLTTPVIEPLDFSDDRLSHLLKHQQFPLRVLLPFTCIST
jgi:hypothetical protein